MSRSGARVVMEALDRHGVRIIFGYPGGVVLPLYDEILRWPGIRHILVRHEQAAAHMADGYARATGQTGVCLATSGPGATNLVTGIATAMMDSVPMVVITGQVNSWAVGTDAFQETDIQGITIPITKHNYLVTDIDTLPSVMAEAFHLAGTGRKGPVLVDIPKDVFIAKTEAPFPDTIERRGYVVPGDPPAEAIARAVELLNHAERPVIIAGAGVVWAGACETLWRLAHKADIPVVNSLLGLGSIPREDELSLGMMGMHGTAAATLAVQEADLVIGVGSRFDDRLTGQTAGFAPKAKIIHFDIDPTEFGKAVKTFHTVPGDLATSLAVFEAAVRPAVHHAWRNRVREWQVTYPLVVPDDDRFLSRHVVKALSDATRGEAVVCTDVGQHQMWMAQFYNAKHPRSFISSGGLGTMGYGFPAAVGAKLARPDAEVWAVVGDGGFQMTLQELQTAVEHKVNVNICLLNNGYLGMVRQWQEMFYDNRYSHVALGNPNYRKLADAYGVHFVQCSCAGLVSAAVDEARKHDGPTLCEFVVEMEENLFPMVMAGKSNDHIVMDPALERAMHQANGNGNGNGKSKASAKVRA